MKRQYVRSWAGLRRACLRRRASRRLFADAQTSEAGPPGKVKMFSLFLGTDNPPADGTFIIASVMPTCPVVPERLFVPSEVMNSFDMLSCSAGKLSGPVMTPGNPEGCMSFNILSPRAHGAMEMISVSAKHKTGSPLVRFRSGVVGTFV